MKKLSFSNINICIIGLGYVSLPLAIEFNKKFSIVAYDINSKRIKELNSKIDRNNDINLNKINSKKKIFFTNKKSNLNKCDIYIVTVPNCLSHHKDIDFYLP